MGTIETIVKFIFTTLIADRQLKRICSLKKMKQQIHLNHSETNIHTDAPIEWVGGIVFIGLKTHPLLGRGKKIARIKK